MLTDYISTAIMNIITWFKTAIIGSTDTDSDTETTSDSEVENMNIEEETKIPSASLFLEMIKHFEDGKKTGRIVEVVDGIVRDLTDLVTTEDDVDMDDLIEKLKGTDGKINRGRMLALCVYAAKRCVALRKDADYVKSVAESLDAYDKKN